jgi:hypothetical protein
MVVDLAPLMPIAQGIFSKYLTADDDNPGEVRNGELGSTDK